MLGEIKEPAGKQTGQLSLRRENMEYRFQVGREMVGVGERHAIHYSSKVAQ